MKKCWEGPWEFMSHTFLQKELPYVNEKFIKVKASISEIFKYFDGH